MVDFYANKIIRALSKSFLSINCFREIKLDRRLDRQSRTWCSGVSILKCLK